MCCLVAQVFTSLRRVTIAQKIFPIPAQTRDFPVKSRDSAPTLRRFRHSRYRRQLRSRKLENARQRLVERVALARRYSNFCKLKTSLGDIRVFFRHTIQKANTIGPTCASVRPA